MSRRREHPLQRTIAEKLRAHRAATGLRIDDIVANARAVNLDWSTPTVDTLEAGRRHLSIEELLLVPQIYRNLKIPDLLIAGREPVVIVPGTWASSDAIRRSLAGGYETDYDVMTQARQDALLAGIARELLPTIEAAPTVEAAARASAERKAAAKLGVTPKQIAEASIALWGRSLTAERDWRVDQQVTKDTPARTKQAVRGWVTRQLVTQLAKFFERQP